MVRKELEGKERIGWLRKNRRVRKEWIGKRWIRRRGLGKGSLGTVKIGNREF